MAGKRNPNYKCYMLKIGTNIEQSIKAKIQKKRTDQQNIYGSGE